MDDFSKEIREKFKLCNDMDAAIHKRKQDIELLNLEMLREKNARDSVWQEIADMMRDNGVVEEIIETSFCKFKLHFPTPRQKVVVPDVDAVPDEYKRVKTTVEPDKTAIARHLKSGAQVNWATFERGESTLVCEAVNK